MADEKTENPFRSRVTEVINDARKQQRMEMQQRIDKAVADMEEKAVNSIGKEEK